VHRNDSAKRWHGAGRFGPPPTAHPGEGLTFLYDDHVGWPLKQLNDPQSSIRTDRFGRTLPVAPRLPVSGSLIYFGDVM